MKSSHINILMKGFRTFTESEKFTVTVNKDDVVKIGKFKNRVAVVKDIDTDEHGQPVLDTDKGKTSLLKGRLEKLEPAD